MGRRAGKHLRTVLEQSQHTKSIWSVWFKAWNILKLWGVSDVWIKKVSDLTCVGRRFFYSQEGPAERRPL